jgi:uncharacterized protein
VIEMGLVKLYRETGEKKYLDLAKFFLDARGAREDGEEYSQSHKKVVDQTEAVGHSVRQHICIQAWPMWLQFLVTRHM